MGKVAIIGLGLIGGSMGLAIRRAEPVDTEVVGYDRDARVAASAVQAGAVPKAARTVEEAVAGATLVIIATPVISIQKVLAEIAPRLQRGAVVTDTASTKLSVMGWAREILPPTVHFIGGHPMAGKEKSGPQAAEASLFDDRPYAIVPPKDAMPGAVSTVVDLVSAIGARPLFVDAEEHDAYAAAVSHVPLVSSIALFNLARGSAAWPELANMAGPAFHDLTRLAAGAPEMSHDICLTNRDNILHWLDRYVDELYRLRSLIEQSDAETLFRTLAETQLERESLLAGPPRRKEADVDVDLPSPGEAFTTMIAGGWIRRSKEVADSLEEQAKERERKERLRRRE